SDANQNHNQQPAELANMWHNNTPTKTRYVSSCLKLPAVSRYKFPTRSKRETPELHSRTDFAKKNRTRETKTAKTTTPPFAVAALTTPQGVWWCRSR
ncbi:hypothetical protein A2U01_0051108, partial [Trifolium medium]|nr:hypothetical protein [Trifolium medium]